MRDDVSLMTFALTISIFDPESWDLMDVDSTSNSLPLPCDHAIVKETYLCKNDIFRLYRPYYYGIVVVIIIIINSLKRLHQ